MRQEGQYFLSDNDILYKQSYAGKRTVIQLVVPKTTNGALTLVPRSHHEWSP